MKDKIVSWFLRNIVLPRTEDIENPGFIVLKLSGKKSETYLREVLFPEDLLVDVENKISDRYGDPGRQVLYSAGKRFGWRYASLSKFNKKGELSQKEIKSLAYYLVRYIECSFASKLKHEIDLRKNLFRLNMDNFVICSKNGLGYIMTSGGISGIWAYVVNNPGVEGVEVKCQGRGAKMCEVICANPRALEELGIKVPFTEKNLSEEKLPPDYLNINRITPVSHAKKSLKDLVSSNVFQYSKGMMNFKGSRYFLLESGLPYLIEQELGKLRDGKEVLFDSAFQFGYSVASKVKEKSTAFITDYLSALGWGDVYVSVKAGKYKVISRHFPWTEYSKDSDFTVFTGIVSGLLSAIVGKNIELRKTETSLSLGFLDVITS